MGSYKRTKQTGNSTPSGKQDAGGMRTDRLHKKDIIFILAALAAVLLFYAGIHLRGADAGATVKITVDGAVYGIYALDEDQEIPVLVDGVQTNYVRISDGEADMVTATCPDLLCVHQKKISKANEMIVCLPNKVVVEVVAADGEGGTADFDAVAN